MKIYDALEDNFLKDKAIEINFSKPINKKEKDFLKFLFVEFTLKKDFQKKEILEISINKWFFVNCGGQKLSLSIMKCVTE